MSTRSREHPKHRDRHDGGRRRPPPLDLLSGVPHKVSAALDALDEPGLTAVETASALFHYANVVTKPRARLTGENNDWLVFEVPIERDILQAAIDALPERHAVHLKRIVARLDDQLLAKTINDYRADQSWPWWSRRWQP